MVRTKAGGTEPGQEEPSFILTAHATRKNRCLDSELMWASPSGASRKGKAEEAARRPWAGTCPLQAGAVPSQGAAVPDAVGWLPGVGLFRGICFFLAFPNMIFSCRRKRAALSCWLKQSKMCFPLTLFFRTVMFKSVSHVCFQRSGSAS